MSKTSYRIHIESENPEFPYEHNKDEACDGFILVRFKDGEPEDTAINGVNLPMIGMAILGCSHLEQGAAIARGYREALRMEDEDPRRMASSILGMMGIGKGGLFNG